MVSGGFCSQSPAHSLQVQHLQQHEPRPFQLKIGQFNTLLKHGKTTMNQDISRIKNGYFPASHVGLPRRIATSFPTRNLTDGIWSHDDVQVRFFSLPRGIPHFAKKYQPKTICQEFQRLQTLSSSGKGFSFGECFVFVGAKALLSKLPCRLFMRNLSVDDSSMRSILFLQSGFLSLKSLFVGYFWSIQNLIQPMVN